MADHSNMRLGKKPRKDDRLGRTLKLARYFEPGLPPPKPAVDWLAAVKRFPMYGNDVHGDCAIAAIGHMIQVWSANVGNPATPSQEEILRVYRILSPDDDGCVLLDVLKWWRQNPIAGVQLGAFVAVNWHDMNEVKTALELFGGLYAGAALPLAAETQNLWAWTSGPDGVPNSWGGHCINFGQYAGSMLMRCVTWGQIKDVTLGWMDAYLDELYALISPDWFGPAGTSPEGFDMATLKADLNLLTGPGNAVYY
jgi:hypothetical protein